jgi:hypothetical protein
MLSGIATEQVLKKRPSKVGYLDLESLPAAVAIGVTLLLIKVIFLRKGSRRQPQKSLF